MACLKRWSSGEFTSKLGDLISLVVFPFPPLLPYEANFEHPPFFNFRCHPHHCPGQNTTPRVSALRLRPVHLRIPLLRRP
jgi:hypothetical protein